MNTGRSVTWSSTARPSEFQAGACPGYSCAKQRQDVQGPHASVPAKDACLELTLPPPCRRRRLIDAPRRQQPAHR